MNSPLGEKRKLEDATSDVIMVMRTTLSKKEFASALGMKEADLFVTKMFNIVDKDQDGRISFQEFLDTIVLFSKGIFLTREGFLNRIAIMKKRDIAEVSLKHFDSKTIRKYINSYKLFKATEKKSYSI